MKIHVITDTHLGHDRLVDMGQGRPDDFSQQILNNLEMLNRVGYRGDLLIHLGDVCIGKDEYWHELLLDRAKASFRKVILVRGNHDNKSDNWYYGVGWDFVCTAFAAKYFGKKLLFTHKPLPFGYDQTLDHNIHGHLHGLYEASHRASEVDYYKKGYHIDVAPELYGYEPVKLEKLWS